MMEKLPPAIIRQHKGISFVGVTTCFICHDGHGRFYMDKRSSTARDEPGVWEIGGGGLKWGQTAEGNALREAKEEYDATSLATVFLGYRDVFRQLPDGTPTHWLALDYALKVNPEQLRIRDHEAIEDAGWFTFDAMPSPLHSQHLTLCEKYRPAMERIWDSKRGK